MNNKIPKYEYHLLVWGGFYNSEFQNIHKEKPGDYWFDTAKDRQIYLDSLKAISTKLNAVSLIYTETEGYCCRIRTKLHRIVEYDGKKYYSECDMGINYPFDAAKFHLNWKWTCGFNDYPLGEHFDYDKNPPKVIQEWITGADQNIEKE